MNKRLYRDKANGKFLGVCAGLAEYFGIDPSVVRIAWVVLMFMGFFPIVVTTYFILGIFLPVKPEGAEAAAQVANRPEIARERMENLAGQLAALDREVSRLETYVTSDTFELKRKIRSLQR